MSHRRVYRYAADEAPPSQVQQASQLGGTPLEGYGEVLLALIHLEGGAVPVLRPLALLEDGLLASLREALRLALDEAPKEGAHA